MGYVTALYTTDPPMLVQNNSVPKGYSSLRYERLKPGTRYAWEICSVAGPYISLPLRLSNWTCECQGKYNILLGTICGMLVNTKEITDCFVLQQFAMPGSPYKYYTLEQTSNIAIRVSI